MDGQKVLPNNDDCNNRVSKKFRFWKEWKQGNINMDKEKVVYKANCKAEGNRFAEVS